MNEHSYSDEQRAAVYRVIEERRDVRRGFRSDPVPPEVLTRVIAAAHRAPSVGFSQPWDFIVITDRGRRERIKALAEEAHPADPEPFGPGGEPQVRDREHAGVGRGLRLAVPAQRVPAAAGRIAGHHDVDRRLQDGLGL